MDDLSIYPDVIADRYELHEMISEGGMSAVFRCVDTEIGADCAIKLLSLEEILSDKGRDRFEHECQMLTHFDHPNIIHNLDYGIYQDIPYLVMELCVDEQGRPFTLRQLQMESAEGRLDWATMEQLLPQILQGMTLFHQHGLVHRDIKPENILLVEVEGNLLPKIIDFGLVAITGDEAMRERMQLSMQMELQATNAHKVVGTLNYMAPEQMAGHSVDARSDVYSLGLLLFRLTTGETLPSESPTAMAKAGVPDWAQELVLKCTKESPAERPVDAAEMLALLPEELRDLSVAPKNLDRDAPTVHQLRESANTIILKEPIGERYQVLEEIDRNEVWTVYLCRDLETGQMRSLKRLATKEDENSGAMQRFMHECDFLSGISHPNILQILDFGIELDQPYVVMEHWAENKGSARTLQELINISPGHRLSAKEVQEYLPPIISAVADLHRHGLLHKDITPDNVLLVQSPDGATTPKLKDFAGMTVTTEEGLKKMPRYSASRTTKNKQDQEMALIGTYEYMSPEQKQGQPLDQRTDVYSLGLMVYRLATGFERIGYQLPSEVNPELPPWVDEICQLSLEEDRDGRASSAVGLLESMPEELRSKQDEIVEKTRVPDLDEGEQTETDTTLPNAPEPVAAEVEPDASPVFDLPPLEDLTPQEEAEAEIPKAIPIPEPPPDEMPKPEIPKAIEIVEAIPKAIPIESVSQEDLFAKHMATPRLKPIAPKDEVVRTNTISVSARDILPEEEQADMPFPDAGGAAAIPMTIEPIKMRKRKRRSKSRSWRTRYKAMLPSLVVAGGVAASCLITYMVIYGFVNDVFRNLLGFKPAPPRLEMTHRSRDTAYRRNIALAEELKKQEKYAEALSTALLAREYAEGIPAKEREVDDLVDEITALKNKPAREETTAADTKKADRKVPQIGMDLKRIEKGEFMMGEDIGYWGPKRKVKMNRPFWMAKHEVTQGQYQRIMGDNPSKPPKQTNKPVDSVTWHQAVAFCAELTSRERHEGLLPEGYEYRLPTEAEWEYACRAGSPARYCFGNDPKLLGEYAWAWTKKDTERHPVAQKLPNAWGLHDMHGNVNEWCLDAVQWKSMRIVVPPVKGEQISPYSQNGPHRVYRGGSIRSSQEECIAAKREALPPGKKDWDLGFRFVLGPELKKPE